MSGVRERMGVTIDETQRAAILDAAVETGLAAHRSRLLAHVGGAAPVFEWRALDGRAQLASDLSALLASGGATALADWLDQALLVVGDHPAAAILREARHALPQSAPSSEALADEAIRRLRGSARPGASTDDLLRMTRHDR